jgi:hypothetical protein
VKCDLFGLVSQDDYDELCRDFAHVCQQQIAARDAVRSFEQDLTSEMELLERSKGGERDLHAGKQQEATQKLAVAKAELEKVTAERQRVEKLLEKAAVVGASQPAPEAPKPAKSKEASKPVPAPKETPKAEKSGRKGGEAKK